MGKKVVYSESNNSALNFNTVMKELEKITEEKNENRTIKEVMKDFVQDLQNYGNNEYQKKVQRINIGGDLSEELISSLIKYTKRLIINAEKKEEEAKKKEKREEAKRNREQKLENALKNVMDKKGSMTLEDLLLSIETKDFEIKLDKKEKAYVSKKIKEMIEKSKEEDEKKRKSEEKTNKLIQKSFEGISKIIDEDYEKTGTPKFQYWESIRASIVNKEENDIIKKLNGGAQSKMLELINNKIEEERNLEAERKKQEEELKRSKEKEVEDLLYYEQTKVFTNDFDFLAEYPEIVKGMGRKTGHKFTDVEAYSRFVNLRTLVNRAIAERGISEHSAITGMIEAVESNYSRIKLDEADIKILNARKNKIEEKSKKLDLDCKIK